MFVMFLCAFIAVFASFIGSISGIGGGIIIKPILDLTGQISINAVNFMSGVTVLTMSTVSLLRYFLKSKKGATKKDNTEIIAPLTNNTKINLPQILVISLGSLLGGLVGTQLFNRCLALIENHQFFVLVQAILILLITVLVMLYQYNRKRVRTFNLNHFFTNLIFGHLLGLISAFLGIGGGPLNVAALSLFFSMTPKISALSSHIIIFSSQLTSLITSLVDGRALDINLILLACMMVSAVVSSLIGRSFAAKMSEKNTSKFFTITLWLIFFINIVNVVRQWLVL